MTRRIHWLHGLIFAAALAVGVGAGVGACDAVDTAFDCQSVCSRYKDCFDQSFDVGACRSSCRTRAENDPNVRQQADACEACIDDRSCASATFSCGTQCAGVIAN